MYGIEGMYSKHTPLPPKWNPLNATVPANAEAFTDLDMRQGIGYLMYAVGTRPDFAHAVNSLATVATPSKSMPDAPTKAHKCGLFSTLRYLAGTRTMGLTFRKGGGLM